MKHTINACAALCAAILFGIALAGCPMQTSYKSTITPVYAATNAGLSIFNGSSWSQFTTANSGLASNTVNSVVVSGSGSGATVFAATPSGISYASGDGASWGGPWTTSNTALASNVVNELFLGSKFLAATGSGISVYNSDGSTSTWTSDTLPTSPSSASCVFSVGTYTYVVNGSGSNLYVYNGTSQETNYAAASILAGSGKVTAVIVDSNLDIFAGTDKGLIELNYYNGTAQNSGNLLPSGSSAYSVNGLFLDANGNLFAATSNGLYADVGTNGLKLMLSGTSVLCVYVDGAGTIYAGTAAGLKVSSNGGSSWTNELAGNQVNAVVTTAPLYSF
jgi:hypothetical protein